MEERAAPSSPLRNSLHRTSTTQHPLPLSPLRPQTPGRINHNHNNNAQTIVVQVPRDQVYHVPPPENANLVSQYKMQQQQQRRRDEKKNNTTTCCTGRRLFYLLGVVLALLVALLVASVAFYVYVRSENPTFSINLLHVGGDGATKSKKYSRYKYEVTVKVANSPSSRMEHEYQREGSKAVLVHRGSTIAIGKVVPPAFSRSDVRRSSFSFRLAMFSSKDTVVPDDIKNSVENRSPEKKGGKKGTPLALSMEIPVRVKIGVLESWKMDMKIKCRVRARFSGEESHVLHQECKTEIWA